MEDIPVKLVSVSKFYKNKNENKKEDVKALIKNNCMKIGGRIINDSINDYSYDTGGPISFGGICIRDKNILKDKSVDIITMVKSFKK